ncbi:hypothetical protein MEO41_27190, partial [Dolichospermum sp. ST_sed4]|nr:hypothetical protein [Dolichospermum sp. ST_sed4]
MKYPKKTYSKPAKKTYSKKVTTKPLLTSDVVKLQKQLNSLTTKITREKEVKEIDFGVLENSVSQVNGQGLGLAPTSAYAVGQLSNSPSGLIIPEGTGNTDRIGNFVNLKRMNWRCQIQNQPNCVTPMKLRLEVWQMLGDPTTLMSPVTLVKQSLLPNYFYI